MKLQLTNFRCFKNLSVEFPQNGTVILWGNSGRGKTTIFKAINFALYGKEQKVTKYGEKKCKVQLEINNFQVVRTKNPSHLTLQVDDKKYEDDEAQSIIDSTFGKDFLLTSYMSQKGLENFFTLSTNEKAIFLQKLALKEFDVDHIRKKVRDILRLRKDTLIQIQTKKDLYKDELRSIHSDSTIPTEPSLKIDMKGKSFEDFLQNEERLRTKNKNQLHQIQKEIDESNNSIINETEMSKRIDVINHIIKEKESFLLQNTSESNIDHQLIINDCKNKLNNLERSLKYIQLQNSFNQKKEEFEELLQIEQTNINKEIQKATTELNECSVDQLDDDEMNVIKKEIGLLKKARGVVQEYQDDIPDCKDSLLECLEELAASLDESLIDNRKVEQTSREKLSKIIEEEINKKNKLDDVNKNIMTLEPNGPKHHLKCPKCSQAFFIQQEKVVMLTSDPVVVKAQLLELTNLSKTLSSELQTTRLEKQKLERVIKEFQSEIESANQSILQISEMKKELLHISTNDDCNVLEKKLNNSLKNKMKIDLLTTQLGKLKNTKVEMIPRVVVLKKQLDVVSSQLGEMSEPKEPGTNLVAPKAQRTIVSPEEIEDEINKIREKMMKHSQELLQIQKNKKMIKEIEDSISMLRGELTQHLSNTEMVNVEELMEKVTKLKEEMKGCEEKEEKFKKRNTRIQKYKVDLELYNKIDKMMKQISSVEHEEGLVLRGIGKAEMLLRKINDAESIALQNTIDNINIDVEEYITNFFGENVSVKLQAFKESNKGKEIKPGINIIIMKDGESIDLDNLSGGEADRVCLAFFLAFNKVSKSNIIMLDESLSSIHAEMVEDIVMYIKERLKDKLILFTLHQCNTGLFDQMIDVESLRSNED